VTTPMAPGNPSAYPTAGYSGFNYPAQMGQPQSMPQGYSPTTDLPPSNSEKA